MTIRLADALRSNRADQLTAYAGSGALIRIYSGTRPATKGGSLSGATLLAQLTCASVFAPASSNGVLTQNTISPATSAAATGVASFFIFYKADGTTFVLDGSVSTVTAGTGDLQLDNVNVVLGGTVAVATSVFTDGNI